MATGSAAQALGEIQQALASDDRPRIAQTTLNLKVAGANIQAIAVNNAAACLEAAARSTDGASLTQLAQKLREEVQRALEYLRAQGAESPQ